MRSWRATSARPSPPWWTTRCWTIVRRSAWTCPSFPARHQWRGGRFGWDFWWFSNGGVFTSVFHQRKICGLKLGKKHHDFNDLTCGLSQSSMIIMVFGWSLPASKCSLTLSLEWGMPYTTRLFIPWWPLTGSTSLFGCFSKCGWLDPDTVTQSWLVISAPP